MFDWFARFTRSPSSPPGLERTILRQLWAILALGCLAIAFPSLALRIAIWLHPTEEVSRIVQTTDFIALGVLTVHLTGVVTVAIGAFMVVVMKGPVQEADSYPLSDADLPPKRMPRVSD
jgi:hypothetical protein